MNNNTLVFKYYADMNDAPLSDPLIQANINTEKQFMVFSDSSRKDCSDTGRSTRAYMMFDKGGTIENGTHVPGSVSQSSAESEYNLVCTAGMDLAHLRMLIHELFNKYPDIFP